MKCSKCHKELEGSSLFCPACGHMNQNEPTAKADDEQAGKNKRRQDEPPSTIAYLCLLFSLIGGVFGFLAIATTYGIYKSKYNKAIYRFSLALSLLWLVAYGVLIYLHWEEIFAIFN